MGVEVRKVAKGPCKCFLFPAGEDAHPESLCFAKGVVGALTEKQEQDYCTPISFKPENQGGIAIDISHPDPKEVQKVQNLIRTMKQFSEGVADAKQEYALVPRAEKTRDLDDWRNKYVGRNVHAVARGEPNVVEAVEQAFEESITQQPKVYKGPRKPRKKVQKVPLDRHLVQAKAAMAEALGKEALAERLKKELE
jgi:hypothetical protein